MTERLTVEELDQLLAITETIIVRLQSSLDETTAVARSITAMRDEVLRV